MKKLALLSVLVPSLALADEVGEIEIGLAGGVMVPDQLDDLAVGATGALRFAYTFRRGAALELEVPAHFGTTKRSDLSYLGLTPRLNFRGLLLRDQPFQAMLSFGVGGFVRSISDDEGVLPSNYPNPDIDLLLSGGPGLRVPVGKTPLVLRTDYKFLLNMGTEPVGRFGDTFLEWEWTLGVGIAFGGAKDTDRDGIVDEEDACINEPEDKDDFEDTDGCPELDNDKDGLVDTEDRCVLEPEDIDEFEDDDGCPDLDNDEDGLEDKRDSCPNEVGPPEALGCPDGDGDGVADKNDRCPEDIGLKGLKGCPDKDEDGSADIDDQCPDEAGSLKAGLVGCPDGDEDLIADKVDACPEEKGPEDAHPIYSTGCATENYITAEPMLKLERAVTFTRAYRLTRESTASLDALVAILAQFEDVTLEVIVYPDAKVKRPDIVAKRAEAVVAHLTKAEIAEERITSSVKEEERAADSTCELIITLPAAEEAPAEEAAPAEEGGEEAAPAEEGGEEAAPAEEGGEEAAPAEEGAEKEEAKPAEGNLGGGGARPAGDEAKPEGSAE